MVTHNLSLLHLTTINIKKLRIPFKLVLNIFKILDEIINLIFFKKYTKYNAIKTEKKINS